MNDLFELVLFTTYHHPHPANDPDRHQARVNYCIDDLGERYLCHPANRIKPIWRGPCQQNASTA